MDEVPPLQCMRVPDTLPLLYWKLGDLKRGDSKIINESLFYNVGKKNDREMKAEKIVEGKKIYCNKLLVFVLKT